MKKLVAMTLGAAAALAVAAAPAFGQHGHGAPPTMSHSPSSTHGMSADHQSGKPSTAAAPAKLSGKSASDLLAQNTQLSSRLAKLLGLTGDSASQLHQLQADAAGFKNLGQFVAAVHVSKNLNIPFDQLKAKMTGDKAESLGKAIQELKPDADNKAESQKATQQSNDDLKSS